MTKKEASFSKSLIQLIKHYHKIRRLFDFEIKRTGKEKFLDMSHIVKEWKDINDIEESVYVELTGIEPLFILVFEIIIQLFCFLCLVDCLIDQPVECGDPTGLFIWTIVTFVCSYHLIEAKDQEMIEEKI